VGVGTGGDPDLLPGLPLDRCREWVRGQLSAWHETVSEDCAGGGAAFEISATKVISLRPVHLATVWHQAMVDLTRTHNDEFRTFRWWEQVSDQPCGRIAITFGFASGPSFTPSTPD